MIYKDKMYSNIALIGMPSAGKTYIGSLLAQKIDFNFIDTDRHIEKKEGKTIEELLNDYGDEVFKKIEEQRVLELNLENYVISTGGSVVFSENAVSHLRNDSLIVQLDIEFDEMKKRLDRIGTGPIVGKQKLTLEDNYKLRLPLYKKYSDFSVKVGNKPEEAIIKEILDKVAI